MRSRQERLDFLREQLPEREYPIYGYDGIIAWCAMMGIRDGRGKVPSRATLRRWRNEGKMLWMRRSRGSRFHNLWTTNYVLLACLLGLVNLKRGTPQVPSRAMNERSVSRW